MCRRILIVVLALVLVVGGGLTTADAKKEKLMIRIVSDTGGPPQPIAIAMNWFRDKLQERISGSEVRTYFAGALYTLSDAMTALQAGNLEIAVGQPSKVAGFEPWMNIITQPMVLTSVAAIHHFPETEVAKMLIDRMSQKGVKILGFADISHYLGVAAKKTFLSPPDFKGEKLRVFAPLTQLPTLKAWGASPVAMAWGDVPSAIQSGVVDGALTSTNGFGVIKDQTPHYTIIGVGGLALDYYFIGIGTKWWGTVAPAHQKIIEDTLREMITYQRTLQWCSDQLVLEEFGTKDPKKPGVYVLKPDQVEAFKAKLGNAVADTLAEKLGDEAKPWIYKFQEAGKELTAKYPPGTDPVESVDCEPYRKMLTYKEKR
jgi:C4-dicarboxylate-binding protein DctP